MSQKDQWDEGVDEEILKSLIELRRYLENHITKLNEEIDNFRALFKIVDEVIVSKSFRGAESLLTEKPSKPSTLEATRPTFEPIERIPLMTNRGVLLAEARIHSRNVHIVPVKEMEFKVNTPPFHSFFISRILESMKGKDDEAVRKGEILPEMALSFDVVADNDIIHEIIVKNYGDENRLREIQNSCRWTFEKMFERKEQA